MDREINGVLLTGLLHLPLWVVTCTLYQHLLYN